MIFGNLAFQLSNRLTSRNQAGSPPDRTGSGTNTGASTLSSIDTGMALVLVPVPLLAMVLVLVLALVLVKIGVRTWHFKAGQFGSPFKSLSEKSDFLSKITFMLPY